MAETEDRGKMLVRHKLTGTPCQGIGCEECVNDWLLTGQVYLTVTDAADTPAGRVGLVHTD